MENKSSLKKQRKEKDRFFELSPQSPIPTSDRGEFDGLDYYPEKEELRFRLELQKHEEKERIEVEDSKGGNQEYFRWGEFRFRAAGDECVLQAYKSDAEEDRLWVPFKDNTNGQETYGAGRYIDLESSRHKADGKWLLDFNQAYNPFCAYNEDYVCPFIPPENWLEVPIRAGEKKYDVE